MKISKRKKPHDLHSLPAWARELIWHLRSPRCSIYRTCRACGWPKEEGFYCQHCDQDDIDVPAGKEAVPFYD